MSNQANISVTPLSSGCKRYNEAEYEVLLMITCTIIDFLYCYNLKPAPAKLPAIANIVANIDDSSDDDVIINADDSHDEVTKDVYNSNNNKRVRNGKCKDERDAKRAQKVENINNRFNIGLYARTDLSPTSKDHFKVCYGCGIYLTTYRGNTTDIDNRSQCIYGITNTINSSEYGVVDKQQNVNVISAYYDVITNVFDELNEKYLNAMPTKVIAEKDDKKTYAVGTFVNTTQIYILKPIAKGEQLLWYYKYWKH